MAIDKVGSADFKKSNRSNDQKTESAKPKNPYYRKPESKLVKKAPEAKKNTKTKSSSKNGLNQLIESLNETKGGKTNPQKPLESDKEDLVYKDKLIERLLEKYKAIDPENNVEDPAAEALVKFVAREFVSIENLEKLLEKDVTK